MTQKDALYGEPDPLWVDPTLFDGGGGGSAREHSPAQMRAIATELRVGLDAMLGRGTRPDGNIHQLTPSDGYGLSTAQIGVWNDAAALASTVGSDNAGRKFAEVYQRFIDAYQKVVEAVEVSAANHDKARRANEGDA